MLETINHFKKYLHDNLGISVTIKTWKDKDNLSLLLQGLYEYSTCSILDTPCLLVVTKGTTEGTPATLRKHFDLLQQKSNLEPVYLRQSISAHNRKRLIEHKVSFVIPENQMYLPFIGIDLREHLRKLRSSEVKTVNPATQAILLYCFYNRDDKKLTAVNLAQRLKYSIMTFNRAFNELHSLGLGVIVKNGREFIFKIDQDRKSLWEKALEFLRSPVMKRIYVASFPDQLSVQFSGLTALSHYSMLSEPQNTIYAVSSTQFNSLENKSIVELPSLEPQAFEIEVWSYSPQILSDNGIVDRLSLYLSLRDSKDERVEAALEEMMESFEW